MAFTVPGYHVDQLIGYGSHAEVWSGRTAGAGGSSGTAVALKRIILPAHGDPDRAAELVRSARAEAALLSALEHPSLIRLHQYVRAPAAVVLVMELAEGGSLAQLLRRRDRLSPAEVAAALSPVAAALSFAHSEGVLHGDISAANILFNAAGQPKLADLGLARMLVGQAGADRALGTPAYVDPVVAAGGAAGTASDVFSLAAVALHCVTGSGPWHSAGPTDLHALLDRAAAGVIENLPGKLAGCPEAMARVLTRALDPDPQRRGSAAEFALDLGASVPSAPVVLSAGRILPGIGRHSVERHSPAGMGVVQADLTHVARLQVREEPAAPVLRRGRVRTLVAGPAGLLRSRGAPRAGRRRDMARPARRLRDMARPATRLISVLTVACLGVAVLALVAGRSRGWPVMAAGPRTAHPMASGRPAVTSQPTASQRLAAPSQPAASPQSVPSSQPAASQQPATSGELASSAQPATSQRSEGSAGVTAPTANPGTSRTGGPAGDGAGQASGAAAGSSDVTNPEAVLRELADRRAEAFARNRPDLLATVYQSPALLAQDLSQLSARVPAGCGLAGLRTSYQHVIVARADQHNLEVRATASQPPASLICAGTIRGRTQPAGATRLVLRLVRVGADFRIASQRAEKG